MLENRFILAIKGKYELNVKNNYMNKFLKILSYFNIIAKFLVVHSNAKKGDCIEVHILNTLRKKVLVGKCLEKICKKT